MSLSPTNPRMVCLLVASLLPLGCATTPEPPASEPPIKPVVQDYDSPPKPIKITRPQYPQEAYDKKIEGVVVVEILIDITGRVTRARILQSVPLLDAAALQTVYQWVFSPAIKDGRPVPTVAHAPIRFMIY